MVRFMVLSSDTRSSLHCALMSFAIGILAFAGPATGANPSSKDPSLAMDVHGTIPEAKAIVKRLYDFYNKYEQVAIDAHEKRDAPATMQQRELSRGCGEVWKSVREAKNLEYMGEPAAADLIAKLRTLEIALGRLAITYSYSPAAGDTIRKNLEKLKRTQPRRIATLDKIMSRIQSGDIDGSEKELHAMGVELCTMTCFIAPTVRNQFLDKFLKTVRALDTALSAKRTREFQQQAKQAFAPNTEKISAFSSEARRVRDEISASGKFTLGEEELGYGRAILHLGDEWGKASLAQTRNLIIQYAYASTKPSELRTAARTESEELAKIARSSIVVVIQAAAKQVAAEDVEQVYSEILKALSYVDRRVEDADKVSEYCKLALQEWIAQHKEVAQRVAAYKSLTSEVLRWREAFATQRAHKFAQNYPAAASKIVTNVTPKQSNKPLAFGPKTLSKRVLGVQQISSPASWTVFEAGSVLDGARVSEANPLRLKSGSLTSLVPFGERHYSMIAVGMPISKEFSDLKKALFIDEKHPPLTIETADAISSAEWEDFEQVGGEISKVHLEGAVTRFLTLPDFACEMTPLGTLPLFQDNIPPVKQICWRLDIAPHWVRHKYFIVEIPSKTAVTKN